MNTEKGNTMGKTSESFEQSVERVRALLVAKGVEGAAMADTHNLALLAEKHTDELNQAGNGARDVWGEAFGRLGIRIKTKRSGGQAASAAATGARSWKEIMAAIEGRRPK